VARHRHQAGWTGPASSINSRIEEARQGGIAEIIYAPTGPDIGCVRFPGRRAMRGPLAGVRIIELAGIGPTPHAAMMLGRLPISAHSGNRRRSRPALNAQRRHE
jgi:hypothetical protein